MNFIASYLKGFGRAITTTARWTLRRVQHLWKRTPTQGAEWLSMMGAIIVSGVLAAPGDYFQNSPRLARLSQSMQETGWIILLVSVALVQFATVMHDEQLPRGVPKTTRAKQRITWKLLRALGGLHGTFVWLWFAMLCALGGGYLGLMALPFAIGSAWAAIVQCEEIREITDNCAHVRRMRLYRFARRHRDRLREHQRQHPREHETPSDAPINDAPIGAG